MYYLSLLLLIISTNICANTSITPENITTPLPVNQAFQLSPHVGDDLLQFTWHLKPNHYLYKQHFHFTSIPSNLIGKPLFPDQISQHHTALGNLPVFQNEVTVTIPFKSKHTTHFTIEVQYQGCAGSSICYPPQTRTFVVKPSASSNSWNISPKDVRIKQAEPTSSSNISQALAGQPILHIILLFIGLGILLSFTPCILPMIPVLMSILSGQKRLSKQHAFYLALTYVLSMSTTYALMGLAAGILGSTIQAQLQQPIVIVGLSALFMLLGLSLLECYTIKLPGKYFNYWQNRLTQFSQQQQSGSYIGVAIMGILATLILSPCISAPLIGILGFLGQSGSPTIGALALFSLGLGMGLPLLIIATTLGHLLPKVGQWMNHIKALFGFMLLAMAIFLLSRLIPATTTLALNGILLLFLSFYTWIQIKQSILHKKTSIIFRLLSLLIACYSISLIISTSLGNTSFLPTYHNHISTQERHNQQMSWHRVSSLSQLQQQFKLSDKPIVLDFYAQWCTSCKDMEEYTFKDTQVNKQLSHFTLLRVDMTTLTPGVKSIMEKYHIIAPPMMLFFTPQGHWIKAKSIAGYQSPKALLQALKNYTQHS